MSPFLSLSQRLTQIIEPLRAAVASHAGRNRSAAPVVLILWTYLRRLAERFAAAAARPRRDRPAANDAPRTRLVRDAPRARLPQGFGWLLRLAPGTAIFGCQLRHLLSDPEMAALLAATPRAASILRPLCRMLLIGPDPDLPAALFVPGRFPAPPGFQPVAAHLRPPPSMPIRPAWRRPAPA